MSDYILKFEPKLQAAPVVVRLPPERRGRIAGMETLLTAKDVAAILRCAVGMVYKLRCTGRLKAVKLGSEYRWKPATVRAYMDEMEGR